MHLKRGTQPTCFECEAGPYTLSVRRPRFAGTLRACQCTHPAGHSERVYMTESCHLLVTFIIYLISPPLVILPGGPPLLLSQYFSFYNLHFYLWRLVSLTSFQKGHLYHWINWFSRFTQFTYHSYQLLIFQSYLTLLPFIAWVSKASL
jgi:hypothetical protein